MNRLSRAHVVILAGLMAVLSPGFLRAQDLRSTFRVEGHIESEWPFSQYDGIIFDGPVQVSGRVESDGRFMARSLVRGVYEVRVWQRGRGYTFRARDHRTLADRLPSRDL